jgi:anhydro-N-acetylmuramic acid kinase
MPDRSRILLGAMSGTSADGVDVAAAKITGRGLEMKANYLAHVEHPYDAELRRHIFAVRESGQASLEELAKLGRDITLAYAAATKELLGQMSLDPRQVAGLAAHGQTLFHAPPDSIQWLDPALLAAQTDLAVISDFRLADLAAGGQGAPLVPFADWILFRHPEKTRVILNIGGIANLTYLPAGGGIEDVIAFDTGPGNCISDWIMRRHDPGGPGYDDEGVLAEYSPWYKPAARVYTPTTESDLGRWFALQPYFKKSPPKSTDVGAMIAIWQQAPLSLQPWLGRYRANSDEATSMELAQASLAVWHTVHSAVIDFLPERPDEVIVAGGGVQNVHLMKRLRFEFPFKRGSAYAFWSSEEYGLPIQAREAVCFAILGAATLDGEPSNVPSATGARRRVVLGSITPRPGA